MSYATPETFKPGERWLVELSKLGSTLLEVRVLEWSESRLYVKLKNPESRLAYWEDSADINPIERLPDESSVNQTAKPAGAVEGDSGQFNYCVKCGKPNKDGDRCICAPCQQEVEATQVEIVRTICRCERCEKFRNAPKSDDHGTD